MRPLRLLLSLVSFVLAITLLLFALGSERSHQTPSSSSSAQKEGKVSAFFSWHTPLFPPSAIISLTDDNSTFFLARPAAFGPLLPSKGLSGQIWVGSGFGADNLGRGGLAATTEGELGCSDVPGWDDGVGNSPEGVELHGGSKRKSTKASTTKAGLAKSKGRHLKRDNIPGEGVDVAEDPESEARVEQDDGTDDYLHEPATLSGSTSSAEESLGKQSEHADIQSIQESAEIAGKIVLLSRGGCGFLEKAKWVQRRGGVALIVGDNIRGGPLITMYAKGDTSNITIPALFTSHTTAHLLSALIPTGGYIEDVSPEDLVILGSANGEKSSKSSQTNTLGSKKQDNEDRPIFTHVRTAPRPTSASRSASSEASSAARGEVTEKPRISWFRSILSLFGMDSGSGWSSSKDSRRPPSSGHIDWVVAEDWDDDKKRRSRPRSKPAHRESRKPTTSDESPSDGFVIGVHDWRDPDLVAADPAQSTKTAGHQLSQDQETRKEASEAHTLKGGSITPGSGEYEKPTNGPVDIGSSAKHDGTAVHGNQEHNDNSQNEGWFGSLGWNADGDEQGSPRPTDPAATMSAQGTTGHESHPSKDSQHVDVSEPHEGLWVTLTPTSMSSSPFFDTLLVLVVSPLVTLTVVYALLLLRSRWRRRRWRAPKSVVERLPVRTYHTISSDNTASPTPLAAPASASPTTPLLQSNPHPNASRSRPRSRTASEVPVPTSSSFRNNRPDTSSSSSSSSSSDSEKRESGLAEWRRRYGGRQKECVVCLEEYVDGVSRVMSLPCGHEFHAECITPWLTTRRRTCPICKGDVVRMSHGSSARPQSTPQYRDDPSSEAEEDVQAQVAQQRNDSPSAAMPVPPGGGEAGEEYEDLERGVDARPSGGLSEIRSAITRALDRLVVAGSASEGRRGAGAGVDRNR